MATHHRRPDIVLIVVDDLMRTTLPSYGASSKFGELTPYMNRLLKGGTVFENAYTTSAICTPSRLSLMTTPKSHAKVGQKRLNCNVFKT